MTRMLSALRQIGDCPAVPIAPMDVAPAMAQAAEPVPETPVESCALEPAPAPEPAPEPAPAAATTDVCGSECHEPLPEESLATAGDAGPEEIAEISPPPAPDTWDCPAEWAAVAARILDDFPPGRPGVLWFANPGPFGRQTDAVASLAAALVSQVTGEIVAVDGNLQPLGLIEDPKRCQEPFPRDDFAARRDSSAETVPDTVSRWGATLSELRRTHQLVLIDGAAAGDLEAELAGRYADAVYVVIVLGRTGRRAARQALATLRAAGARVLGSVVVPP
jgi:hypothetical protein